MLPHLRDLANRKTRARQPTFRHSRLSDDRGAHLLWVGVVCPSAASVEARRAWVCVDPRCRIARHRWTRNSGAEAEVAEALSQWLGSIDNREGANAQLRPHPGDDVPTCRDNWQVRGRIVVGKRDPVRMEVSQPPYSPYQRPTWRCAAWRPYRSLGSADRHGSGRDRNPYPLYVQWSQLIG